MFLPRNYIKHWSQEEILWRENCHYLLIHQGRTWFRNFRVRGVRQSSPLKQAKQGTLEYSGVNQAITVLLWKTNTIRLPRRRKKNDKLHGLSIHFTNDHVFFNIDYYQNVSVKTEKIYQYSVGSAPPFYFGTGHVTVLSAPPWKTEYSGVRQHRCSSALDFSSTCSEWKE